MIGGGKRGSPSPPNHQTTTPMPDRSKAPDIHNIENLNLPVPRQIRLDNGLPVYIINMGTQPVVKLEIVFFAGRPYEHKKLASRATVGLLKEGVQGADSAAIAEHFDFYGSSLSFPFNLDTSNIVLYSLGKYFDKVLPMFAALLTQPTFPEEELQRFIKRNRQRLQIDLQKNDLVAYRQITEDIFGSDHPYGYNSYLDTYERLERADLIRHFERHYNSKNGMIIISGRVEEYMLEALNRHLGQSIPRGTAGNPVLEGEGSPPGKRWIDHPDSVQAAVRIGRRLFDRKHPDYFGMYVLCTVLGGYFGSRLMENIREEKGYTYNIYSMIDTMTHDGFFYIGTEVGNKFVSDTRTQIYREMQDLQENLIGEEELQMVRNYLLGNFLTMLDGPFNVSELVKDLLMESLPLSHFEDWVQAVRTVPAVSLRELARRYFRSEDLTEVIVGKRR